MNYKIIIKNGEVIGLVACKNSLLLPTCLNVFHYSIRSIHPVVCSFKYINGMLYCIVPPTHFLYNSFNVGADIKIVKKIEDILKIKIIK